jgi:hypothetical protein
VRFERFGDNLALASTTEGDAMMRQSPGWGARSVDVLLTTLKRLALVGLIMTLAGLVPIVIYALSVSSDFATVVSVGAMAGAAAFVAGGFIGFLFGVPKTSGGDDEYAGLTRRARYRVNTNLEQVSDWLTKILVGVGLIQLARIAAAATHLISVVAKGMGGGIGATSIAGGILVVLSRKWFPECLLRDSDDPDNSVHCH